MFILDPGKKLEFEKQFSPEAVEFAVKQKDLIKNKEDVYDIAKAYYNNVDA